MYNYLSVCRLHQEQTRNNSLEGNVSSLLRQLEDKELVSN